MQYDTHTQYYIHHTQLNIHKLLLDARVVFPVDSVSVSPDIQFHTNNPKSPPSQKAAKRCDAITQLHREEGVGRKE